LIELVLRIGFSLLIVFGLMWALARVVRRPLSGRRGPGSLAVLHRQQLSRGSSVAIVQVAERALVLGVTDQQVSLLGETDLAAFETEPDPGERRKPVALEPEVLGNTSTRRSPLDFLRDRTTRQ
jgi:flagellar protein FliO/FliZ